MTQQLPEPGPRPASATPAGTGGVAARDPGVAVEVLASAAWWEKPLLFSVVFSVFFHVALALLGATVFVAAARLAGLGDADEVTVGDASATELTSMGSVSLGGGDIGGVRSIAETQEFSVNDLTSPFADADRLATDTSLSTLSGAGSGGGGLGTGPGTGDGLGLSGAGGEARFFGVEARGSRFAFVIDVSGSMMDPAKIGALQVSLTDSVEGMLEQAHFCVVMFSGLAQPLLGPTWTKASDESKRRARTAIRGISPNGGTNPLPAIELVFKLKPRPDAIYFMTDGVFTPEVEKALPGLIESYQRDGDGRVPFYCITFVDRGSEKLMRRIANLSGGSYTHVEAPKSK
jgi:hypothetical protein